MGVSSTAGFQERPLVDLLPDCAVGWARWGPTWHHGDRGALPQRLAFFCFCGIRAGVDARRASVPQAVQLFGSPHAMGWRGALGYMSACCRTCLSAAWVERQG